MRGAHFGGSQHGGKQLGQLDLVALAKERFQLGGGVDARQQLIEPGLLDRVLDSLGYLPHAG